MGPVPAAASRRLELPSDNRCYVAVAPSCACGAWTYDGCPLARDTAMGWAIMRQLGGSDRGDRSVYATLRRSASSCDDASDSAVIQGVHSRASMRGLMVLGDLRALSNALRAALTEFVARTVMISPLRSCRS